MKKLLLFLTFIIGASSTANLFCSDKIAPEATPFFVKNLFTTKNIAIGSLVGLGLIGVAYFVYNKLLKKNNNINNGDVENGNNNNNNIDESIKLFENNNFEYIKKENLQTYLKSMAEYFEIDDHNIIDQIALSISMNNVDQISRNRLNREIFFRFNKNLEKSNEYEIYKIFLKKLNYDQDTIETIMQNIQKFEDEELVKKLNDEQIQALQNSINQQIKSSKKAKKEVEKISLSAQIELHSTTQVPVPSQIGNTSCGLRTVANCNCIKNALEGNEEINLHSGYYPVNDMFKQNNNLITKFLIGIEKEEKQIQSFLPCEVTDYANTVGLKNFCIISYDSYGVYNNKYQNELFDNIVLEYDNPIKTLYYSYDLYKSIDEILIEDIGSFINQNNNLYKKIYNAIPQYNTEFDVTKQLKKAITLYLENFTYEYSELTENTINTKNLINILKNINIEDQNLISVFYTYQEEIIKSFKAELSKHLKQTVYRDECRKIIENNKTYFFIALAHGHWTVFALVTKDDGLRHIIHMDSVNHSLKEQRVNNETDGRGTIAKFLDELVTEYNKNL